MISLKQKSQIVTAIACLTFPFLANSSNYQTVVLPTSLQELDSPKMSPIWADEFVISNLENNVVTSSWLKSGSSGFSLAGSSTVSMLDLAGMASSDSFSLLGSVADTEFVYSMVKGNFGNYVLFSSKQGSSTPDFSLDIKESLICDKSPLIERSPDGVIFYNGCDTIVYYDQELKENWVSVLGDGDWFFDWTLWYSVSDDGSSVSKNDSTFWVGNITKLENETKKLEAYSFNQAGEKSTLFEKSIEPETTRCDFLLYEAESAAICRTEGDLYTVYGLLKESNYTLDIKPLFDEEENERVQSDWTAFSSNGHVFLSRALTITKNDAEGDPVVYYDWRTGNYKSDSGENYQLYSQNDNIEPGAQYLIGNEYKVDPTGSYSAALIKNTLGFWEVAFYNGLRVDSEPRLLTGLGGNLVTSIEYEQEIYFDDDDTLFSDLVIDYGNLPSYASILKNDESDIQTLFIAPLNSDTGTWAFNPVVAEPDSVFAEFPIEYEISLIEYAPFIFEETLFGLIDESEALPMSALVSFFNIIEISEDVEAEFVLSFDYRSFEELQVEWLNLPLFISWDPELRALKGTPEQSDVGDYTDITLRVFDSYSDDKNDFTDFSFPIRVYEVDELFEIRGDGSKTISVGESYSYTPDISDEETKLEDMEIQLGSAPLWMNFNSVTKTITGIPSEGESGTSFIQMIISDEGGNVVIHGFDVTVLKSEDEESGSLGYFLLLTLFLAFGRRTANYNLK